jgi:hypothetical protein
VSYKQAVDKIIKEDGVEQSTMMHSPCLRYRGDFIAMMFDKEDALIIKVSPERVNELIEDGKGVEFTFTKKRFKKWVLIPIEYEDSYLAYIQESLKYAQRNG